MCCGDTICESISVKQPKLKRIDSFQFESVFPQISLSVLNFTSWLQSLSCFSEWFITVGDKMSAGSVLQIVLWYWRWYRREQKGQQLTKCLGTSLARKSWCPRDQIKTWHVITVKIEKMVRVDEVLHINIRRSQIYAHEKQQNTTPNNLPSNSAKLSIVNCSVPRKWLLSGRKIQQKLWKVFVIVSSETESSKDEH